MSMGTKEDLDVQALVNIVVERARKAGMNNISDKHMDCSENIRETDTTRLSIMQRR